MSPTARQELTRRDNIKFFAKRNFEENENGFKRYLSEVTAGKTEEEARTLVKDAFSWGDRRLDRVLETRASTFSPKTASELEARALVFIQKVENAISACCRHCDDQLDELEDKPDDEWVDVELTEQTGGKFEGVKTKRLPVREAKKLLLDAKLSYAKQFGEALKALKVDTIINIGHGASITDYSAEELVVLLAKQQKAREGREVKADFSTD